MRIAKEQTRWSTEQAQSRGVPVVFIVVPLFGSQIPEALVCNVLGCNRPLQLASEYIVEFTRTKTKHMPIDPLRSEFGMSKTPPTTQDVLDLMKFSSERLWSVWKYFQEI